MSFDCTVISSCAHRTSQHLTKLVGLIWASISTFPTTYWTSHASYSFILGKKMSWQYWTTSGQLWPLKYKPFLYEVYQNPSWCNHHRAVANEITFPTLRCIQGKSASSMYCFKPCGISSWTTLHRYFSASAGTSLFLEKSASLGASIAHLFEHMYMRNSIVISGSLSNENTFAWRPVSKEGSARWEIHVLVQPRIWWPPHAVWVKVWIWVGVITQTQHQQRTTKKCEWWFTSMVSREDVLRRGRGDLHQQGDADRDTGYSWGTGAIEDEGDRCLDSSYSLGSVKAGIG